MKITLIELDPWCSMAIHQSVLTPISNFFLSSEIVTMWQTDGIAYKLKPRLFYKAHISKPILLTFTSSMDCA